MKDSNRIFKTWLLWPTVVMLLAFFLIPSLDIIRSGAYEDESHRATTLAKDGDPGVQAVRRGYVALVPATRGLAEAVSILHTAPLFMTALSVILLREKVGLRRWTAILAGFAGMMMIIRPGASAFDPASLFAVLGAIVRAWCDSRS